jgi:hypothetical protein
MKVEFMTNIVTIDQFGESVNLADGDDYSNVKVKSICRR